MQISGIPSNIGYHFNEALRDVPDDPARMSAAVEWLQDQLDQQTDDSARLQVLGWLGFLCRMLGRLDEAEHHLRIAVELAQTLNNEKAALVNQMRLGHVVQWQRRFDQSDMLLEHAVEICLSASDDSPLRPYLHFAYQHLGKNYFDQGRYAEAVDCFTHALSLREAQSAPPDLLESSELALKTAHRLLAHHSFRS